MSTEITYTLSEQTEKKYTVQTAAGAALTRLGNKSVCLDKIMGRPYPDSLTLVEVNTLADSLVDDTLFWTGTFQGVGGSNTPTDIYNNLAKEFK
jgi:hypothetical protein